MKPEVEMELNQKALLAKLKALKCMNGLSPETLSLLASAGVLRTISANEHIWNMGDSADCICVVISGLVEISRQPRNANEIIMGFFGPSDVMGISAVLQKATYPGTAKALFKGTEVLKLFVRQALLPKGPQQAELQSWLREMLLRHEQVLRDKIDVVNAGSVENRVFELLCQLARRFGRSEPNSRITIPIRITRAQIGKIADARVETIIRLLSRWQKQKLLRWAPEGIVVENLSLLEKALDRGRSR